jgi:hypothetical protein
MTNEEILAQARQQLELAIQTIVRVSRENDDTIFIQDYAIVVCSESMAPGRENLTYTNTINRVGMAAYQVIGLHQQGAHYYLMGGEHG